MKIFDSADRFCKESNWKTIAALKLCLLAIGVILGMEIPEDKKKAVAPICAGVYGVTLVPLLKKYFAILFRK